MHRTCKYEEFTIDVAAEPVDETSGGPVLLTSSGYVAVVHNDAGGCTEPIASLCFSDTYDGLFGTHGEALMRLHRRSAHH